MAIWRRGPVLSSINIFILSVNIVNVISIFTDSLDYLQCIIYISIMCPLFKTCFAWVDIFLACLPSVYIQHFYILQASIKAFYSAYCHISCFSCHCVWWSMFWRCLQTFLWYFWFRFENIWILFWLWLFSSAVWHIFQFQISMQFVISGIHLFGGGFLKYIWLHLFIRFCFLIHGTEAYSCSW
jgi:hypothetical protein